MEVRVPVAWVGTGCGGSYPDRMAWRVTIFARTGRAAQALHAQCRATETGYPKPAFSVSSLRCDSPDPPRDPPGKGWQRGAGQDSLRGVREHVGHSISREASK